MLFHVMTAWGSEKKVQFMVAALPLSSIVSFCHGAASKYKVLFQTWENSHRNTQNAWNCSWKEALSCMHILEWFKVFRKQQYVLKMIQGMGSHQLLKIWKQLLKFLNWWTKNIKWPYNWWGINCTLIGRWFVRFFVQIW